MKEGRNFSQCLLTTLLANLFLAIFFNSVLTARDVHGTQSGKWIFAESPYMVQGDVVVPAGATLTIEPGVIVKFSGYYRIIVRGNFVACGELSNRIIFTSDRDFEFDDTGSAAAQEVNPKPDDWNVIEFVNDGKQKPSEISNCLIRYCANVIQCTNTALSMKNLLIVDCNTNQMFLNGALRTIQQGRVNDLSIAPANARPTATVPKETKSLITAADNLPTRETSVLTGKGLPINTGESGGFRKQLEHFKIEPYVHGYAVSSYRTRDINQGSRIKTFNLHYFNMIFGINVIDKVVAEMMTEYEHGGTDIGIRYGFIDYTPVKFLTVRSGKFLMPIGKFNEYYYPEYLNKLADRPYCLWRILPSVWAEVGIQLRGAFQFYQKMEMNYAIFAVNGLEGEHGKDIRELCDNFRDTQNGKKSFGGRIGFIPFKSIEVGGSAYRGAYTANGYFSLRIVDLDAEYKGKNLNLRGEYIRADQNDWGGEKIVKKGLFSEAAYRINSSIEPALRYEEAHLGRVDQKIKETLKRITCGISFYPEPVLVPRFLIKLNYAYLPNDGLGKTGREIVVQSAIGF